MFELKLKEKKLQIKRRPTITVKIGNLQLGSRYPVLVQSMTNTDTRDTRATLAQIKALQEAGCDFVRVAVPDREAAKALKVIVKGSPLPVVADIHFNYRLALESLDAGVSKLRINPGNIGGAEKVLKVAQAAREKGVPIRIGVNSGSLEKKLLDSYGGPTAEALVESALGHCNLLEDSGFRDIVVSIKASDVPTTVTANRLFAGKTKYPIHLGITEAGTRLSGAVRSAVGLGILLAEGIGDTIRVSLTADPVEEVGVAYGILGSLRIRRRGVEIISCPTCGRTEVDLVTLAEDVERRLRTVDLPITVAVMGCVVNGPGEAREADFGIAAGRKSGVVFRHGEEVCKATEKNLVKKLLEVISTDTGIKIEI